MMIKGYQQPKSSFLSVEKDLGIIIDNMLKNERLKRLLYYTSPDALERSNIGEDNSLALIGKNIKIVPKLYVDGSVLNYIIISFDNFTETSNPEFRDNVVEFDIICHFDQWQMRDFALRPYKIAAEIDTIFDNKKLTGLGRLEFLGASQIVLTDEYAGLCLIYRAVHGEEDKKNMPNPNGEERFLEDFKDFVKA